MLIQYSPININNLRYNCAQPDKTAFCGQICKAKMPKTLINTTNNTVISRLFQQIKLRLNNAQIKILNKRLKRLQKTVPELTKETYMSLYQTIKKKLNIVDMDVIIAEINALRAVSPILAEEIYEEVSSSSLNYDVMSPPIISDGISLFRPEDYTDNYENIPVGTSNRSDMQELDVNLLDVKKGFILELPTGEMKIKKAVLKPLDAPFEVQSNISEKYSESVVWDDNKISRDLLQNFFDGHGQTLDGVKFIIKPMNKNHYKVRIEGKSTYNYREAVLMGESSSHKNVKAAGNYGEGLKMVVLKLLTQKDAPNVKIGSGNWNVTCELKKDQRLDAEVMNYKIEPTEEYDGNFIEFETTDTDFLYMLKKSINRFYHSSNPHFKNPDFENDLFGIKLTGKDEKGGLYISGQRFEYEDNFDNSDGVIFIKEKIPVDIYNMTRDRSSIDSYSFRKISQWLAEHSSDEECKQIVKCLELHCYDFSMLNKMHDEFLYSLANRVKNKKTAPIKFPDNYVASTLYSDHNLEEDLRNNGYKLFPRRYNDIGMRSVLEITKKALQHIPLEPTKTEQVKIILLKKALHLLSNLTEKHFSQDELDANIYIFDGKSKEENTIVTYKYTKAEAIPKDGKCVGFWLDRSYLNQGTFGDVLETTLHELSHKAGGDGTKDFGYKLTDVNGDTLNQIFGNTKTAVELKVINDIWSTL